MDVDGEYDTLASSTELTTVDGAHLARIPLTRWQHSSRCVALASDLLTLHQEVAAVKALSTIRLNASFS